MSYVILKTLFLLYLFFAFFLMIITADKEFLEGQSYLDDLSHIFAGKCHQVPGKRHGIILIHFHQIEKQ